jgi:hypothetical protein
MMFGHMTILFAGQARRTRGCSVLWATVALAHLAACGGQQLTDEEVEAMLPTTPVTQVTPVTPVVDPELEARRARYAVQMADPRAFGMMEFGSEGHALWRHPAGIALAVDASKKAEVRADAAQLAFRRERAPEIVAVSLMTEGATIEAAEAAFIEHLGPKLKAKVQRLPKAREREGLVGHDFTGTWCLVKMCDEALSGRFLLPGDGRAFAVYSKAAKLPTTGLNALWWAEIRPARTHWPVGPFEVVFSGGMEILVSADELRTTHRGREEAAVVVQIAEEASLKTAEKAWLGELDRKFRRNRRKMKKINGMPTLSIRGTHDDNDMRVVFVQGGGKILRVESVISTEEYPGRKERDARFKGFVTVAEDVRLSPPDEPTPPKAPAE